MAKKNNVAVAVGAVFEAMLDDVQSNVIRIHEHLMSLYEGNDAPKFSQCLKALRERGGMCKSLASHERTFFVSFGGFTAPAGDNPAKFCKKRDRKTIEAYRSLDPCNALSQLVSSKLSLFEPPKKASTKEPDAKASAIKTIGSWDSEVLIWISAHKSEILDAIAKGKDAKPKA